MKRTTFFLAALISLQAFAGKWDQMNYGPYLTTSLEIPGAGIANKAVAIRLDAGEGGVSKGNAFMLYDTDLLSCAAGWSAVHSWPCAQSRSSGRDVLRQLPVSHSTAC